MSTFSWKFLAVGVACGMLVLGVGACDKGGTGETGQGKSQPVAEKDPHGAPMGAPMGAPTGGGMSGHPPIGGAPNMPDHEGPTDGQPVALKVDGLNSAAELSNALTKLSDATLKGSFETAFRMAFSARQAQRNYPDAAKLAAEVIAKQPDFAPAHRVLGYARFNTGDPTGALNSYRKAVELDPNYGEGQYALAFMYAMSDKAAGIGHYRKAIELGVKDERDIGRRFYGIGQ